jgi:hypothetical protein
MSSYLTSTSTFQPNSSLSLYLTTASAFQTPASGGVAASQGDDDDDGNEGGMGGIKRVADIASNFLGRLIHPDTVANYIRQYFRRRKSTSITP